MKINSLENAVVALFVVLASLNLVSAQPNLVDGCVSPTQDTTYTPAIVDLSDNFLLQFTWNALNESAQFDGSFSEIFAFQFPPFTDSDYAFLIQVFPDSDGQIQFGFGGGSLACTLTDETLQFLDDTFDIKIRVQPTSANMYIDGELECELELASPITARTGGIMRTSPFFASAAPGEFCDVRLFDLGTTTVLPCADHDSANFEFDPFCCVGNACGANEGGCGNDTQCAGDLVCGDAGSCDPAFFSEDASCCVELCAAHEHPDWTFEADCCADNFAESGALCPRDEGTCTSDAQCVGDLFCGNGTCPLGVGFPATGGRCCSECPFGIDDNLEVRYPPLIDDGNTHVVLTTTRSDFTVRMLVPHQYTGARFDFEGATDADGAFNSSDLASNLYWTIDADSDPCYKIYVANIPWDLFRTTLGGTIETVFSDSVRYQTQINIAALRPVSGIGGGGDVLRTVRNVIPFAVTFELEHPVFANVSVNFADVEVSAAIVDLSVVTVMPGGDPLATADLIFVTATPAPLILEAEGVNVSVSTLSLGLQIEELVDQRQCDVEADFCRQFWRIALNPQQCNLDGTFVAMLRGVCHPDADSACLAPLDNAVDITMVTTSDEFCGITQEIGIHGDITLESPSPCNGLLQGSVTCYSPEGAPLNSTSIVQLRASPTQTSGGFLTVFNAGPAFVRNFNFASSPQTVDTVDFSFDWLQEFMRCETVAQIEVTVRVEYQATRSLGLLESDFVSYRIPVSAAGGWQMLQIDEAGSDVNALQLASQLAIMAADTDNGGNGNGEDNGPGNDEDNGAGTDTSGSNGTLPSWVLVIIVLLAVAVCCLAIGGGVFFLWWRKKEEEKKGERVNDTEDAVELTPEQSSSASSAASSECEAADVEAGEVSNAPQQTPVEASAA